MSCRVTTHFNFAAFFKVFQQIGPDLQALYIAMMAGMIFRLFGFLHVRLTMFVAETAKIAVMPGANVIPRVLACA